MMQSTCCITTQSDFSVLAQTEKLDKEVNRTFSTNFLVEWNKT